MASAWVFTVRGQVSEAYPPNLRTSGSLVGQVLGAGRLSLDQSRPLPVTDRVVTVVRPVPACSGWLPTACQGATPQPRHADSSGVPPRLRHAASCSRLDASDSAAHRWESSSGSARGVADMF